jgi:hypothetical protein
MWATILSILGILNPIGNIKKLIQYFNRPQLEIYYDPKETYIKLRDMGFNKIVGNFAHVMVRNKGNMVAKNCVGELRSVEELREGESRPVGSYRHIMQIKWAHEKDWSPKDIEDVPIRLDVCSVHQGYDILRFATEKYASGSQTDFPPGTYKVKIRVKSENARSVAKEFMVKYDAGNFDSLEINNVEAT